MHVQLSNPALLLLQFLNVLLPLRLQVLYLLVQPTHLGSLLSQLRPHLFVALQVSLAIPAILLEFLLQDQVLPEEALLLVLGQDQPHLYLFYFPPEGALFCAFLSAEIRHPVGGVPLPLKQLNVGLFFTNYALDGLVLHLVVLPGTQSIRVLHSLLGALLGLGRRETVDQERDPAIDLRRLQVGKLAGSRPRSLQSKRYSHQLVLERGQREGVGSESELLSVVEAEEEIGNGRCSVVYDLYGLLPLPPELNHLGLDRHDVRPHILLNLKRLLYSI